MMHFVALLIRRDESETAGLKQNSHHTSTFAATSYLSSMIPYHAFRTAPDAFRHGVFPFIQHHSRSIDFPQSPLLCRSCFILSFTPFGLPITDHQLSPLFSPLRCPCLRPYCPGRYSPSRLATDWRSQVWVAIARRCTRL